MKKIVYLLVKMLANYIVMKYLSFFYVFFISLSLFCQDKNKRKYDDGEFIYEFYVSSKDNLKLKKELRYYWYENNRVKSSIYGVKGKVLNGRYVKTSLDSGEIMEEGSFFYGVKDGEWKEWNKGGGRKRNEVWKKGYLDGKYELYGDNSELLLTGIYKKGKKTGIWKEYKVGGVRVLRTWFKDVLDGRYKMYEKGKLIISGRYRKGLKHGVWINSKRKEKYRFDKGQLLDEKDKTFWSELFGKKKDTI
ncbi:toxin-antitoxin system YwqK family antitoxin [Xanthomarina gelatinilytica]|uniref:toxin-antitoxin system YwqK family antitoxin n=2 Tax=Flavobacteriaceae TaxID=49546 RepID=UPI003AA91E38